MKTLCPLGLGLALLISNSDGPVPAGEQQTLTRRIYLPVAMTETGAGFTLAKAAFFVRSYGGKCLDFGPPPQVSGSPVFIHPCNGTLAQQVVVQEINDRHEVILRADNKVIGVREHLVTTLPGSAARASGGAPISETPLELQNEASHLTVLLARQIFALDGDSIILAANRNLVAKVQNNRGSDRTPLVLGRRDLADSEFWTFTATNGSDARPTSGFVRVSQINDFDGGTQAMRDFLNAVHDAKWGTVIELDPNVSLYLTDMPPLDIKAGVTIRGDRRGTRPGPLLAAVNKHHQPAGLLPGLDAGMLFITGDHARITRLRMQGPSRGIAEGLPYANAIAAPDQFISIIDHNEMFDWTAATVYVPANPRDHRDPPGRPQNVRVVRNFIHHNHMWGNGYGVVTYGGNPVIEGNTFLSNRHAISASNNPLTQYTASFNLVLSESPNYGSLGFSRTPDFDMHGTLNEGCQYCGGAAGWHARIARNTFLGTNRANFTLRGLPGYLAEFQGNVSLRRPSDALLIRGKNSSKRLIVVGNQFDAPNPMARLGAGDFDGDGRKDLFLATGAAWYYIPIGTGEWRFLNAQTDGIGSLRFGDADRDGRTDVFTQHGSDWVVSWGGASKWEKIDVSAVPR